MVRWEASGCQGLVCFITLLIQCQVACKKEQRQASVSVSEFDRRVASSWVNVCSLIQHQGRDPPSQPALEEILSPSVLTSQTSGTMIMLQYVILLQCFNNYLYVSYLIHYTIDLWSLQPWKGHFPSEEAQCCGEDHSWFLDPDQLGSNPSSVQFSPLDNSASLSSNLSD